MTYYAFLHHAPGSSFGVSFPDVPGCFSGGETEEGAKARAGRALALHIEELQALGLPVPAPSRLVAAWSLVNDPAAVPFPVEL